MRKIGIIGGTGMLGQPVVKAFLHAGYEVILFVRSPNRARQLFGDEAKIFTGDLQNRKAVQTFLEGVDTVYLNLSVAQSSGEKDFQPEREGLTNILEAAKAAGINRIGYLSSLVHFYQGQNGFFWWAFDLKEKAVAAIRDSGIPYLIFYPSTFMESFDKGAYRQGNMIALAGDSRHKMFLIAGADYGKQVVRAFEKGDGNQEYVVQGQEGFTADEAAAFYRKNYQGSVSVMKAPLFLLRFFGRFTNRFRYGANIIEALNNYPERFEAQKTWQELGRPETTFLDYIRKAQPAENKKGTT